MTPCFEQKPQNRRSSLHIGNSCSEWVPPVYSPLRQWHTVLYRTESAGAEIRSKLLHLNICGDSLSWVQEVIIVCKVCGDTQFLKTHTLHTTNNRARTTYQGTRHDVKSTGQCVYYSISNVYWHERRIHLPTTDIRLESRWYRASNKCWSFAVAMVSLNYVTSKIETVFLILLLWELYVWNSELVSLCEL